MVLRPVRNHAILMYVPMRRRRRDAMTVSQTARLAGISRSYASRILRGVQAPSLEVAKRMCKAMNVGLNDFVAQIVEAQEQRVAKME